jgi:D-alanyl-D-alanine carboxypeptidase/D-alanyl-D-alanine-endopeptidase (penicillin-binding protein 4)
VVISPIVVNDNVIDVVAAPGAGEGAPVKLQIRPETVYAQFQNHATTGKAGTKPQIDYDDGELRPDGTRTIIVTGSLPVGRPPAMYPYAVAEPSRFAAVALTEALRKRYIEVAHTDPGPAVDFQRLTANYNDAHLLAEHVSPPLAEEVKVTLKVSQNLHASMMPFTLGAILAHATKNIDQAGFDREHAFLEKAGLDLSGAAQSDGAGGRAFFSPDFMVHYLTYMATRPNFPVFHRALPVLGRDGTLVKIQTTSPAAGHVFAKTGTDVAYDALNKKLMVLGKGLAGYIDTPRGQHLVFAVYLNMVEVSPDNPDAINEIAGEALGKIAAAAYDSVPDE